MKFAWIRACVDCWITWISRNTSQQRMGSYGNCVLRQGLGQTFAGEEEWVTGTRSTLGLVRHNIGWALHIYVEAVKILTIHWKLLMVVHCVRSTSLKGGLGYVPCLSLPRNLEGASLRVNLLAIRISLNCVCSLMSITAHKPHHQDCQTCTRSKSIWPTTGPGSLTWWVV